MPHRRFGRRFSFRQLDAATCLAILKATGAPRHLLSRRATTPAALDALLDPRRRVSRPKGCTRAGGK